MHNGAGTYTYHEILVDQIDSESEHLFPLPHERMDGYCLEQCHCTNNEMEYVEDVEPEQFSYVAQCGLQIHPTAQGNEHHGENLERETPADEWGDERVEPQAHHRGLHNQYQHKDILDEKNKEVPAGSHVWA